MSLLSNIVVLGNLAVPFLRLFAAQNNPVFRKNAKQSIINTATKYGLQFAARNLMAMVKLASPDSDVNPVGSLIEFAVASRHVLATHGIVTGDSFNAQSGPSCMTTVTM
jgi:hypothetical protein